MKEKGQKEEKKTSSRHWVATIRASDFPTLDDLLDALGQWPAVGQLEEGKLGNGEGEGYLHWQVYISAPNAIRFETLKKRLPTAHFEKPRSRWHAFHYCQKDDETFRGFRFNHLGLEEPRRPASSGSTVAELHAEMLAGASADDLIHENPKALGAVRGIRELEAIIQKKKNQHRFRDVEVHFIHGAPGVGKTHAVYEREGFGNLFSVSSYANPWDSYRGEEAILLDEFNGQLEIEFLLKLLDRYPLELPARYADKWAGFTRVYIVSNLSLDEIFAWVKAERPAQWGALLRRITTITEWVARGEILTHKADESGRTPWEGVRESAPALSSKKEEKTAGIS